jgi:hypothetical protein
MEYPLYPLLDSSTRQRIRPRLAETKHLSGSLRHLKSLDSHLAMRQLQLGKTASLRERIAPSRRRKIAAS